MPGLGMGKLYHTQAFFISPYLKFSLTQLSPSSNPTGSGELLRVRGFGNTCVPPT
uniref:Uncharacterized protein n=1 Tax=Setaria italica TaxID=4555 RepID=K3YKR3_SETIT